jgi:hypothetical protein
MTYQLCGIRRALVPFDLTALAFLKACLWQSLPQPGIDQDPMDSSGSSRWKILQSLTS